MLMSVRALRFIQDFKLQTSTRVSLQRNLVSFLNYFPYFDTYRC